MNSNEMATSCTLERASCASNHRILTSILPELNIACPVYPFFPYPQQKMFNGRLRPLLKQQLRFKSKSTRMAPETFSTTGRWFVPPKIRQLAEKIEVPFYEGEDPTLGNFINRNVYDKFRTSASGSSRSITIIVGIKSI